ncbi:MAG: sulfite exporter TauE/SafE family protein [Clostridia bacterium]
MIKFLIIGGLSGLANGFFGAGGGMILVPLFINWLKFEDSTALATSVSIILPLSLVSAIVYSKNGAFDLNLALPFLIGGFVGGIISGTIFKKMPILWLKRFLGVIIIYGGIRSVFLL